MTVKKTGKKRTQGKNAEKSQQQQQQQQQQAQNGFLFVDPARVRFQHSRIRPLFSGCGRSIYETLESIRNREISAMDLPPIQVIVGPDTDEGPWYFSLNNRRLWVLKRCREEGLLENNLIKVRVRAPKSDAEAARYSLENCAVEAKVMKSTGVAGGSNSKNTTGGSNNKQKSKKKSDVTQNADGDKDYHGDDAEATVDHKQIGDGDSDEESGSDSDDDDTGLASKNPFSALL